jgi:hypothetical protein
MMLDDFPHDIVDGFHPLLYVKTICVIGYR